MILDKISNFFSELTNETWLRPSIGLWFGAASANEGDGEGGEGGLVLGGYEVSIGLLLGSVLGFGKKYGLYTGLMGAFALIPLLGAGFIGIPIGFHWRKRIGIGLIIPVYGTSWWIGLLAGIILFTLTLKLGDSDTF